jgi:hypothetical protein
MRGATLIGTGLLAVATTSPAAAQAPEPAADVRVVVGVTLQGGVFGDDNPKGSRRIGLTVGVQRRWRAERRTGPVLDVAFQVLPTRNPHFDESLRVLSVQIAPEIGRTTYVRIGGGIALHFWSGPFAESPVGLGPSVGLAVGRAFTVGDGWRVRPEFAARASVEPGAAGWTLAAQVPIARVR